MNSQKPGERRRGEHTIKIVDECLTAIESQERSEGDLPRSTEHAQLTERIESGLRYIEFSDTATECYEGHRWSRSDIAPLSESTGRQLGEYLLVREIGRGGMGVVYEAVQPALARRVALKILPFSCTLDPRQLMRFRNESLAAAQLDHPNIVRVISVGQDGDMHYYAMQYVEGESLAHVLDKLRHTQVRQDDSTEFAAISHRGADVPHEPEQEESALPPTIGPDFFRRVARWGAQAADGLEHAHEIGVIHRDIKPSNLLLDSSGRILITDFGVALIQNAPELTMTGDLLGTARYMSPEQWQGKPGLVDHRADIYSLGATLYELLTLRPVLKGNDREQLHRQMVDDTPPAPRALVRLIPRELETIVLKALSKDRDERYASAQEMADDLRRFLNDQPILARRPTVLQRLFRWARKHRTLVAVGVLMLAVVAVGLAFSTSIVSMQRDQIQAALSRNRDLLGKTQRAQALAAQANHELREHLYSVNIRLAYRAWHTADVGHAVRLLQEQIPRDNEVDYRGIEWRLLWQKLHTHRVELVGHRDEVYATAYSGDGKWLATGGKDTRVCVWNAATGELRYTIESHKLDVNGLAFRDDGRQLATVSEDGLVRLFDVSSGHQEHQLSGHALGVFCVQYIPGSDLLVSAGRGGTVRLWDSRRYEQLAHFTAHSDNIESIDVSPDGKLLATASRDDTIRLWDLETRQPVRTLKGHRDTVLAVAFSPDGKRLASGGEDLSVLLWDVATGKLVEQMQGHQEWIQSVAFASQGDVIVSASKDSTVRLWETSTGKSIDVLRGHRGRVWNATVSPDGHTLATAGADGAVKLWSWPAAQRHGAIRAQEHPFTALAVAPDGQLCAVADAQGWLTLLDISSGCTTRRMRVSDVGCQHVLFVANGASLVTASQDGKVRLWETATGELKAELCQCEQPILALRLHPSQTSVVCLSGDGKQHSILRVWQIDEPSEGMVVVHAPIGMACCAEFARDGGWLLLGKPDGELLALNWTSQEIACMWEGHPGRINEICLNADGTLLATSGQDGLIKIWSWPDCQLTHSLPGHSDTVRAMAFTADGRTLASGGEDGVTRLWNVATGQELTMLARFENRVGELAILPDDRGVIVLSDSVNDDGLAGWFTDATVWRQPLLHAPTE